MSDAIDNTTEHLISGYSGRMLGAVSIGWMAIQVGRQVFPPLLPTIIESLQISPFTAGLGLSLMWVLYALSHYPGGCFSDHLSRRTVLVAGLIVLTMGFVVLSIGGMYALFLFGICLVGVGSGLYFITMRTLLSDLFVVRRGQAFGIQSAAGNIGSVLAGGIAVVALSMAAWTVAFIPVVILLVISLITVHFWSHEPYVFSTVDLSPRDIGARLFGSRSLQILIIAYSLFALTWQGVITFLPTYLQVNKGFSPMLASGGYALIFVVGLLVMPISGTISDRYHRVTIAIASLCLSLVGLGLLIIAPSVVVCFLAIILFGMGLMAYTPVMQAYLMDYFPDNSMGGDFGAFKTIYSGGGSIGPAYVGFVASVSSYTTAFLTLICCLIGCTLLLIVFYRT
jgi:MFS family permease